MKRSKLTCNPLAAIAFGAATVLSLSASASEDEFAAVSGHWKWSGYSRIVTITNTGFAVRAVTEISCLVLMEGERQELAKLLDRVTVRGADGFTAQDYAGINVYHFERIPSLPATCEAPSEATPQQTFDVFWQYFDDNYAFFEERGIDWDARYARFRPKVEASTSDEELFRILSDMVANFDDAHVNILAGPVESLYDPESDALYFSPGRPAAADLVLEDFFKAQKDGPEAVKSKIAFQFMVLRQINEHLKANVLKNRHHAAGDELLLWGEVVPGIGYFAVHSMAALFTPPGSQDTGAEVAGVEAVLDEQIIPFLADKKAVILDTRFNGGGHDAVSMAIAARFADTKRLAFTKAARDGDGFLPAREIYVAPQGPAQYVKPVYLLTSSLTASAAEIFTLAMMTLPHVTRVGQTTNGILSDQWIAPLPNGWMISLSNEVYMAADGVLYEGPGVPAEVDAPVFVRGAFWENVDKAYEAALALARAQ